MAQQENKAILAFPDLLAPAARFGPGPNEARLIEDYSYFRDRPRNQRSYFQPSSFEVSFHILITRPYSFRPATKLQFHLIHFARLNNFPLEMDFAKASTSRKSIFSLSMRNLIKSLSLKYSHPKATALQTSNLGCIYFIEKIMYSDRQGVWVAYIVL